MTKHRKKHMINSRNGFYLTLGKALDKTYEIHGTKCKKTKSIRGFRSFPSILIGHKVKLILADDEKIKGTGLPENKVNLTGWCGAGKINLFGLKKAKIDSKKLPPYFEIEIDLSKIKPRNKSDNR